MKSRRVLVVGLCGMVAVGLASSVSAATAGTSENKVTVSYDYTGSAEPVDPKYGVSIPTGMVFDSKTPDNTLDISVSMKAAQGETEIKGSCKATVSVKSSNEYTVKLSDGSDAVKYIVKYGADPLTGKDPVTIGTLVKNVQNETENTKIEGSAKLNGVATKTGNHTDTLIYTIENVTVAQS